MEVEVEVTGAVKGYRHHSQIGPPGGGGGGGGRGKSDIATQIWGHLIDVFLEQISKCYMSISLPEILVPFFPVLTFLL